MESKNKRLLIAACSAAAGVIAIAAIIVPIIAGAQQTTTSAATVEVVASAPEPAEDGADSNAPVIGALTVGITQGPEDSGTWRVPVDAPFSTMPEGSECGPAQMAWLAEHAEPGRLVGESVYVQVRNSADDGAAMSLGNIRSDGELVEQSQVVTLQCGSVGDAGSQIIHLELDGTPGVWGEASGWEEEPQPEGSVATLNLSPGEVAEVTFVISESTKRFQGRIIADRAGPDAGEVVLVDGLDFPSIPVPGYWLTFANGPLECSQPGQDTTPCTFADAEDLLKEAGRR